MLGKKPSAQTRQIARSAAKWMVLLESGAASDQDRAALQDWRNSCHSHEEAWQKVQALRQRFGELHPALALASLDRPQLGRRALLKQTLGVAALFPAAWLIGRQLPMDVWQSDFSTSTGERKQVVLADGSLLQLNTASAIDVDLVARHLRLIQGEVALKVPGVSPLKVRTSYGEIIVSRSEICVRQSLDSCRVSVLSGSVELRPLQGPALALQGGQRVSMKAGYIGEVESFDVHQPGWREGVLMAQNQPLGDFLRELSRYRPGILRWDLALEELRVTGSFRLEDTDQILALLAASLPVEVHMRTRYWVTLLPRKKMA